MKKGLKTKKIIFLFLRGCSLMWNCPFCHGWKEKDYHPVEYKTKKCTAGK